MRARKTLVRAGAAAALVAAFTSSSVQALPLCTTTVTFATGIGSVMASQVSSGFCVQSQDKLYGNFILGNLTTVPGLSLDFSHASLGGLDFHGLAFSGPFSPATTYGPFGYEVAVNGGIPGTVITRLDSDFTQTVGGPSTLTKNTTPGGSPATGIIEIKVGPIVQAGSDLSIDYTPGVTDLVVTETLVDAGAISSVINTIVQTVPTVPRVAEPGSLTLLGLGLAGLGLGRRRRA